MSTSSSKAKTMAELMQRVQSSTSFKSLQKGETVKGIITKLSPSEIFVDVSAKTHAMVLEKDKRLLRALLSRFKVGDSVEVTVLSAESDYGYPVVSMRRYLDAITWDTLSDLQKNKKTIPVTVVSKTSGGYLVNTLDGMAGFLPNSQSQLSDDAVGKKIAVYILELVKENKRIIVSQKPLMDKEEFEKAAAGLKTGKIIEVTVTSSTSFGVFVVVENGGKQLDGLIHVSELAWENPESELQNYAPGQKVQAQIIDIDKDTKRIDLSVKRLTQDPFEEIMKQYSVDQKVSGEVEKIMSNGLTIKLDSGIEGFMRKDKIPPTITYEEGQELEVTIVEIDKKKHRLQVAPVLKTKPIGYR